MSDAEDSINSVQVPGGVEETKGHSDDEEPVGEDIEDDDVDPREAENNVSANEDDEFLNEDEESVNEDDGASLNEDDESTNVAEEENPDEEKVTSKPNKSELSIADDYNKLPYDSLSDGEYSDSETDSDIDSDEEYNLSKIDNEKKLQYIKKTHTQELSKTYDEIRILTQIRRTKTKEVEDNDGSDVIINDKIHKTIPILTKYEKTRVLGLRISQLNEGAPRYIKSSTIVDNNVIAEKELRSKKLPFIITRPLPNGEKEYWRLQDLEVL